MLVLGLNAGATQSGKRLRDGGLCIIQDGDIIIATPEERMSRVKHAGGFSYSLPHVLEWLGIELYDFDAIVISSCCESVPIDKRFLGLSLREPTKFSYIPSHHLSHAYSTFFASPFERALIIVMDAGGNVIGPRNHPKWWLNHREQNSYYVGERDRIYLIGRDFEQPLEAGFGEVYRAFTHYLGWHSYTFSANTMALAAYGDPERYSAFRLFDFNGRNLRSRVINNPPDPLGMIARFASEQEMSIPKPRNPATPLSQEYMDLARFIQQELEEALAQKIIYLAELTNIRDLCIAGGVGLNCVANRRILDETPIERIFIQPASGDDGQALGNAFYGYHHILGQPRNPMKFSPYLGRPYDLSPDNLRRIYPTAASRDTQMTRIANLPAKVAEMLSEGKIVAWYQGRSEYGPRALGNRSILADPRFPSIRERCHGIKKREFFRPFSPSVLEERASEYFDISIPSPYMLLVAKAKPEMAPLMPAVLHTDSTARLQTVSLDDNPLFYDLLSQFERLTGVPMILNTSFNRRGEPMVESPRDALDTFLDLDLDILVMGDVLVEKRRQPSISVSIPDERELEYEWLAFDRVELVSRLVRDLPGHRLVGRSILGLYSEYIQLLREGKKSTTIRYRPDAIEYPMTVKLPLLNTGSNGRKFQAYPVGEVWIEKLAVKRFGMLDEHDARRDGFNCKKDLCVALQSIYGCISDNELVSIYHIELTDDHRTHTA